MIVEPVTPSIAILGFALPESVQLQLTPDEAAASAQTQNLALSLCDALSHAGAKVCLLSHLPVSIFPKSERLLVRGHRVCDSALPTRMLGFINLHVVKHATRLIACLTRGAFFLREQEVDILIVHGVHTPHLFFARLWAVRGRRKAVVLLTDPPGISQPQEGSVVTALRRVDAALVKRLVHGFDGTIALTEPLALDFATDIPFLIMEGVVRRADFLTAHAKGPALPQSCFTIAYGGLLNEEYGIKRLVQAVQGLEGDVRLDLYGTGPLVDWLSDLQLSDCRIRYHGALDRQQLLKRLRTASVLVNPRPVDQYFVRYSFPSKLLEYLALGRPVMTTDLPSIPEEYKRFVFLAQDDSVEGLRHTLQQVRETPQDNRESRANDGSLFVLENKTAAAQGERLAQFLATIMSAATV